jgi:DNA-binding NarL/FixJ family response regulator
VVPIRILLANHQPIVRSGLRLLLEREPDFQIVGEAATGREAIALAEFRLPTVLLLEINLPETSGIAVARLLLARNGALKIVFVTSLLDMAYVMAAFKTGAHGYVLADEASADLVLAIRTVACGEFFLCSAIRTQATLPEKLVALLRLRTGDTTLRESGSG